MLLLNHRVGLVRWLLVSGFCALVLFVGLAFDLQPMDDAYITYRAADNLAAGHGLVYNPGEKVETSSAFAFAVLLAAGRYLGLEPLRGSLILSFLCAAALAWLLAYELSRRFQTPSAVGFSTAVALLFLAACLSPIYYVWTGMETIFFTTLLTASVLLFLRRKESWAGSVAPGLLLGVAAATRMEALGMLGAVSLSALFADERPHKWRDMLCLVAGALSVFLPVLGARYAFYGDIFPNTYYAKMDGVSEALLSRGGRYVGMFLLYHLGFAVAVLAGLVRFARDPAQRERLALFLGLIGSQLGFCVVVGGDWFPLYRFVVPVIPVAALLFVDLLWCGRKHRPVPMGWSIMALVLCLVSALCAPAGIRSVSAQRLFSIRCATMGKALKAVTSPDTKILVGAAGALPYYSNLVAYDFFGLTDPAVARLRQPLGPGRAGHEKTDIRNQIGLRRPHIIVVTPEVVEAYTNLRVPRRLARLRRVRWAPPARLGEYVVGSVSLGRKDVLLAVRPDSIARIRGFTPIDSAGRLRNFGALRCQGRQARRFRGSKAHR